ncbi:MAG: outer membrane beta-barrel protein [Alphaproteobacteria bacterium GM7ARS4]|nr:outer membrane beta-barrel protein [Alphaproteobacteria bacterium GM7ARS4]
MKRFMIMGIVLATMAGTDTGTAHADWETQARVALGFTNYSVEDDDDSRGFTFGGQARGTYRVDGLPVFIGLGVSIYGDTTSEKVCIEQTCSGTSSEVVFHGYGIVGTRATDRSTLYLNLGYGLARVTYELALNDVSLGDDTGNFTGFHLSGGVEQRIGNRTYLFLEGGASFYKGGDGLFGGIAETEDMTETFFITGLGYAF